MHLLGEQGSKHHCDRHSFLQIVLIPILLFSPSDLYLHIFLPHFVFVFVFLCVCFSLNLITSLSRIMKGLLSHEKSAV